jgi:hypothetical protein
VNGHLCRISTTNPLSVASREDNGLLGLSRNFLMWHGWDLWEHHNGFAHGPEHIEEHYEMHEVDDEIRYQFGMGPAGLPP